MTVMAAVLCLVMALCTIMGCYSVCIDMALQALSRSATSMSKCSDVHGYAANKLLAAAAQRTCCMITCDSHDM
jgi:drug/metabolite transporter superfamily protein YnfA